MDKTVVAGVVERETGRVQAGRVLPDTRAETFQGFVRERVGAGAAFYADEAHAYASLAADYAQDQPATR